MSISKKFKNIVRRALRYTPTYRKEWKREFGDNPQALVEEAVRRAIRDVPYYEGYSRYMDGGFTLSRFPIIRKRDILSHSRELVSRKAFKPLLKRKETGGSTGMSLELFYSPSTILRKEVIRDYAFSLIGNNLRIASMRGDVPEGGALVGSAGGGGILLSSYLLSAATLDNYLDALRAHRTECLHVYPSAIGIMARLIIQKYGTAPNLPHLKGILGSSEIFSREEKQIVARAFPGVKIVDFYSHNELACAAIAVDDGPFEFYTGFGYVEFMPTGEEVNGNREGEIVATSVMNRTMPFIRYGTDDYVELDADGVPVAVIGRTSDYIFTKSGERLPCMVNTRNISFVNVVNFQYHQPEKGKLIMRIVPNDRFTEADRGYILEDMRNSYHGRLDCDVELVSDVERTPAGKQRRLVQDVK